MPKVIQMLKCFVNSVFKDFIPKDAVETSTEVNMKEFLCSVSSCKSCMKERKHVTALCSSILYHEKNNH